MNIAERLAAARAATANSNSGAQPPSQPHTVPPEGSDLKSESAKGNSVASSSTTEEVSAEPAGVSRRTPAPSASMT